MPRVDVCMTIAVNVDDAWRAIVDVESYSSYMTCVRSVGIVSHESPHVRRTAWSVALKGSILEWRQEERLDHDRHVVTFAQLDGDLETYTGQWTVEPVPGGARTVVAAQFNIGIPLLADMLNPVAVESFEQNTQDMLGAIERQFTTGQGR